MSQKVSVLHVASFDGNIGDNANHNGTRSAISEAVGSQLDIEEWEIRRHYQNYESFGRKHFDKEFVEKANSKDCILIGGGSFFDPWIKNSNTGTTIDIPKDVIDKINSLLIFHGLGCIPNKHTSHPIIRKFKSFLEHIIEAEHCLVSVRNDGSVGHIRELVGDSLADQIDVIPDGGFFVNTSKYYHPELAGNDVTIGINLVADMQQMRFPGGKEYHNYETFVEEFAAFTDYILNNQSNYSIIFIPHIYSDLKSIYDVISRMNVANKRNRVSIAPYVHGMGQEKYIFDLYGSLDIAIGLRFHSNVCPIGLGTPTIGLNNGHPKVRDLYISIGLDNRCISVHKRGFHSELSSLVNDSIDHGQSISKKYNLVTASMRSEISRFHQKIVEILDL